MSTKPIEVTPQDLLNLIGPVLNANNLDVSSFSRFWTKKMVLKDVEGVLAIGLFGSQEFYAIVNMPVLVMPVNGKTLSLGEIFQLWICIGEILFAQYGLKGNTLYFSMCLQLPEFDEGKVPEALEGLLEGVQGVRLDLLNVINRFYPGAENAETASEVKDPVYKLPDIKMTPSDAQVIYGVLARCNPDVQSVYVLLMEKWAKAGFFVETTSSSIVLDIPNGELSARLGMLMAGLSPSAAKMIPGAVPQPPALVLMWQNLREQKGFAPLALDAYQKAVKKIAKLHFTESSAHLDMNEEFDLKSARELLKSMIELAKSVQPELVEPPTTSGPKTPANLARTLELCDARSRKVFEAMVDGWKQARGTVQCTKEGRIYLRIKTKGIKPVMFPGYLGISI